MKVAIIGTVGVPANYGGFETLVEQLLNNKTSKENQYIIYCSGKTYKEKLDFYKGATLDYIPFKANGLQSIIYDICSLVKANKNNDIILILGVSGCSFLPIYRLFSKKKLIINIDGLEHRRGKWNKWIKKFLKLSEKLAIKYGDVIISDNKAIADYVLNEYGKKSEVIEYGGNHILENGTETININTLETLNLEANNYTLGICRIEPENNVHVILEAFSQLPDEKLVFIGNWEHSKYSKALKEKYSKFTNIILHPSNYDLRYLYDLRSSCKYYIHGHSAGGTNPSLVEAMFFKRPILAFDCIYNRETTENKALYFQNTESLISLLKDKNLNISTVSLNLFEIANRRYKWENISKKYEKLFIN